MNQNKKLRALTLGGMITALGIVVLLLASASPGARTGLCAVAGVLAAVVIVRVGFGSGVVCVLATAVLAALLVPNKAVVLLYAAFFGPYALVKNAIERLNRVPLEWLLKAVYCVVLSAALVWLSGDVLNILPPVLKDHLALFVPAALAAFLAYDVVFSKLIAAFCKHMR